MIIYPAIDIRGGNCVRLVEGDFARETVFDQDPAAAARRWATAGAEWIHVVDLDGAKGGAPVNGPAVRAILEAVRVPVQLGGGMRRLADIAAAIEMGVSRVVLGTVALTDPALVREAAARWPGRIAVGLDHRNGLLAGAGWLDQSDARVEEVATTMRAAGVEHFIATDIARDGTLVGPDIAGITMLVGLLGTGVIASGGVGRPEDIPALQATGAAGVIIGRALYDGRDDLATAIRDRAAR